MIITWLGQSCFKIQSKGVTVVLDPFDPKESGLKLPPLQAEIVTIASDAGNKAKRASFKKGTFFVDQPGEYEVKEVQMYAIPVYGDDSKGKKGIAVMLEVEGVSIAHLGDLGHALTDRELGALGGSDILLLPVGRKDRLSIKDASKVISQIDPRMIIPMRYKIPGVTEKLEAVDPFCREMGVSCDQAEDKLKITKADLPQDEQKVVILKATKAGASS